MKTVLFLLLGATALVCAGSGRAEPRAVDVALLLAVDVSLSMDRAEQEAQRDGYVAALTHPAVMDAVRRGRRGAVAIAYVEWGGPWLQRVVAPWTVVRDEDDAAALAAVVAAGDRIVSRGTSISAMLDAAPALFAQAPRADRRVIDVSGDGPNNMGGGVEAARDRALAAGFEINGLPLMLGPPDLTFSIPELDVYYQQCVVGGPNAFVVPVLDRRRFAAAIRQKLVLEIAGTPPSIAPAAPAAAAWRAAWDIDCMVGEKLYAAWRAERGWWD